jgi:hypothetical protein
MMMMMMMMMMLMLMLMLTSACMQVCDHLHLCVNATLAAPKHVAVAKVEEPEANGLVCLLCEIEIETIAVRYFNVFIVMNMSAYTCTGP